MPVCEICSLKKDAPAPEASLHYGGADTTHGVRPILLGEGVLSQHQAAYRGHPHIYEGEVRKLLDLAVAIPSANLPRIAATLAAEKSHDLVRALLDHMSIAEVLAFTKFLDGPRKVRQWTKKLERLSADPNRPVKASTKVSADAREQVPSLQVPTQRNAFDSTRHLDSPLRLPTSTPHPPQLPKPTACPPPTLRPHFTHQGGDREEDCSRQPGGARGRQRDRGSSQENPRQGEDRAACGEARILPPYVSDRRLERAGRPCALRTG
mmetsp:Transcript_24521/g.56589  ORF Transcript_24521/g.56589 Transcript_24521/m.56589 type:complete len:265 (-) Transcript_24521:632-1426(-)